MLLCSAQPFVVDVVACAALGRSLIAIHFVVVAAVVAVVVVSPFSAN